MPTVLHLPCTPAQFVNRYIKHAHASQVGTRQQLQLIAALPSLVATQQHHKLALAADVLLTSLVRSARPLASIWTHVTTHSMRAPFPPKPSSASCKPARPLMFASSIQAPLYACSSTTARHCGLLQKPCCTLHTPLKTKPSTSFSGAHTHDGDDDDDDDRLTWLTALPRRCHNPCLGRHNPLLTCLVTIPPAQACCPAHATWALWLHERREGRRPQPSAPCGRGCMAD